MGLQYQLIVLYIQEAPELEADFPESGCAGKPQLPVKYPAGVIIPRDTGDEGVTPCCAAAGNEFLHELTAYSLSGTGGVQVDSGFPTAAVSGALFPRVCITIAAYHPVCFFHDVWIIRRKASDTLPHLILRDRFRLKGNSRVQYILIVDCGYGSGILRFD